MRMHLRGPTTALAGALTAVSLIAQSWAADVRVNTRFATYPMVVIEGEIVKGDHQTFLAAVRNERGRVGEVILLSPGGDFEEAMKIGRSMRALELNSSVPYRDERGRPDCRIEAPKDPANCTAASAAFFVHVGSVFRSGQYLAVHRPYFDPKAFGSLSQAAARKAFEALQMEARAYMVEMDVPLQVQNDVLATPSDKAMLLDNKTVATYFAGHLPSQHEWLLAKCSSITAAERQFWDNYQRRYPNVSAEESAESVRIIAKQRPESECMIEAAQNGRLAAYKRVFGSVPSDFARYPFNEWASASKYMGASVESLRKDPRFAAKKSDRGWDFDKPGGHDFPKIRLGATDKSVHSVFISSIPDPSNEFGERLVGTLREAWGSPTVTGTTQTWSRPEFDAKLRLLPSADGPFWFLIIN